MISVLGEFLPKNICKSQMSCIDSWSIFLENIAWPSRMFHGNGIIYLHVFVDSCYDNTRYIANIPVPLIRHGLCEASILTLQTFVGRWIIPCVFWQMGRREKSNHQRETGCFPGFFVGRIPKGKKTWEGYRLRFLHLHRIQSCNRFWAGSNPCWVFVVGFWRGS